MGRWDGHTEQDKVDTIARKRAKEKERRQAISAATPKKPRRAPIRVLKPEQPSKYFSLIKFLRRLPKEVVTGNTPASASDGSAVVTQESQQETLIIPFPARALMQGIESDKAYWNVLFKASAPDPSKSDRFWGTGFALEGLLPTPTDPTEYLIQEEKEKQALLEEAQCEEEYRLSQVRIDMRVSPTGELILGGELLAEANADTKHRNALIAYLEACEANRVREKRSRKPRKALDNFSAALDSALAPFCRVREKNPPLLTAMLKNARCTPLLERMQSERFEARKIEQLYETICELLTESGTEFASLS